MYTKHALLVLCIAKTSLKLPLCHLNDPAVVLHAVPPFRLASSISGFVPHSRKIVQPKHIMYAASLCERKDASANTQ